jgi:hypothetical protein
MEVKTFGRFATSFSFVQTSTDNHPSILLALIQRSCMGGEKGEMKKKSAK